MGTFSHRRDRLRDFWRFYHRYTDTTLHTATTVALAIFGLLIFLNPWFAALAIGSYVIPPLVCYALDWPAETHESTDAPGMNLEQRRTVERRQSIAVDSDPGSKPETVGEPPSGTGRNGDTDSDSDDGDTDTDSDDGDTDSDSDDGDTDSDG